MAAEVIEMCETQEIKVQTKEWSNPTAAGLVALAVACFCFFALLNGYVDTPGARLLIGCWLMGGFVIQIVVAFLDLKAGNHTGGNTFLFFSAFFMLSAGLGMFFQFYNGPLDVAVDGFVWVCLSLVLVLWAPAFFKTVGLLSMIVLCLAIALPFLAIIDLGILPASLSADLVVIPAFAMLAAAILAIYLSAAIVVNTAYGRKVYPLPEYKRK